MLNSNANDEEVEELEFIKKADNAADAEGDENETTTVARCISSLFTFFSTSCHKVSVYINSITRGGNSTGTNLSDTAASEKLQTASWGQ